jgi:hypothetical protein
LLSLQNDIHKICGGTLEKTDKMKNAIDFQQACDTNHLRASV